MGYGSTSFAKAPTNILTELDLTAVPIPQCNAALPSDESSPHGITETQICAKDYARNRDTCQVIVCVEFFIESSHYMLIMSGLGHK